MSGVLVLWSYWSLLIGLRHGKKQPIVTRIALGCASALNFAGVMLGERTWGDVVFGGANAILSVVVVARMWKHHDNQVSHVDRACLVISVFGMLVSPYMGQPNLAVGFAVGADLIAFFPVIGKIVKKPETQPVATYFIGFGAAAVALGADRWQGPLKTNSAFTVYLMIIDILLPIGTLCMRAIYRNQYQLIPEEATQPEG
jgi:hypothetical protein